MVQNSPIRGVQPVAHNTNFDSFLVVKNVLCDSSCTPRKQRNTRMDLFRTIETIFVPDWYKNSFNGTKQVQPGTKIVSIVRNKSIRCENSGQQYKF